MSKKNLHLVLPNVGRRRLILGLGALGATPLLAGCDQLTSNATVRKVLTSTESLTRAAQELVAAEQGRAREYPASDISPVFRANGTINPQEPAYRAAVANGFENWHLQVGGLVRQPVSFTLDQLRHLPSQTQITRHDCVEGWSCIGQWTGVRLSHLLAAAQPLPKARYVIFHCADNYYESIDMVQAHHPQTILAYALNRQPLPVGNGAPLRLRVEQQLGYKQAKYIMRIELAESFANIGGGHGGFWEDRGYSWWAGI